MANGKQPTYKLYVMVDYGKEAQNCQIVDDFIGIANDAMIAKAMVQEKIEKLKKSLMHDKDPKKYTAYFTGYNEKGQYVTLYSKSILNESYAKQFGIAM